MVYKVVEVLVPLGVARALAWRRGSHSATGNVPSFLTLPKGGAGRLVVNVDASTGVFKEERRGTEWRVSFCVLHAVHYVQPTTAIVRFRS